MVSHPGRFEDVAPIPVMPFIVVHSIWGPSSPGFVNRCRTAANFRCKNPISVKLALSEPERATTNAKRIREGAHSSWSRPHSETPESDYDGWSSDFLELCNAQLHLLMSTISNLAQAALFFRHENPQTGALEFIPLIVHSSDTEDRTRRVWISSGSGGQTELEDTQASKVLPGGIPAEWILPDYPFQTVGTEGGILMSDGGLCIPIEYNKVLAGSIVLMPYATELSRASTEPMNPWSPEDVRRADMVAKSIALGAALEGKWHTTRGLLGASRTVIESVRSMLRTTLHQIRSPISALVTFGHLLLRKLPPGDANRGLAKNMILEALRVDELIKPLDQARDTLVLPEASSMGPWFDRGKRKEAPVSWDTEDRERTQGSRISSMPRAGVAPVHKPIQRTSSLGGKQLLWLADVLIPVADISSVLVREQGMEFIAEIDEDAPAVMAVEKFVREAVSNLIDNSLKYASPGSFIGIKFGFKSNSTESSSGKDVVEVIVWDTGPGFLASELGKVWDFGFRGIAAERKGTSGSGLGLAIVKELLNASGATVVLESPLPSYLDPREASSQGRAEAPGSAFFIHFDRTGP